MNYSGKLIKILLHLSLVILFMLVCSMRQDQIVWTPYGKFKSNKIVESSGLVKSRQFENVFWTHNDHGDEARIFATTAEGELIREVQISGAQNVDWEDIAIDNTGHLYIGDFGNNRKKQKQLTIYMLKEPNPRESGSVSVSKRIHFNFPDRKGFPDSKKKKFDCEALFWANGHLYCLTKHPGDRITKLYRFGPLQDNTHQTLTKIAEFKIDGAVTAADASIDGSKLLVLCYEYIYLFEKPSNNDNYLAGKFKRILFAARKSEAICFAGSNIFLSNEQGEIYKLPQSIFDTQDAFIPELPEISIPKIDKFRLDGLAHEWTNTNSNKLDLSISPVNQKEETNCQSPSVRIAWVSDGILLFIQDWRPTKSKKKKKKQKLMQLMLGPNNKRTVGLQPGAFVWKFIRSKNKYTIQRKYPPGLDRLSAPQFAIAEHRDRISAEIFIPISASNGNGGKPVTKTLFNLILNPKSSCEWYWATDATMNSDANPYLWGELELQE